MTAATFTLTGTVEGDTSTSRSVYVVINTDVSNPTDDITYQKARRYSAVNGVFSINDLPAWDPLNLPYDAGTPQYGFTVSSGGKKWTVPAQTTGSTHDVTEFEEPWASPVPPDARAEALAAASAAAASAAAAAAVGSTNDTIIAGRINASGSATQVALNAAFAPRWKTGTAYTEGALVVTPFGQLAQARRTHTAGSTFLDTDWNTLTPFGPDWPIPNTPIPDVPGANEISGFSEFWADPSNAHTIHTWVHAEGSGSFADGIYHGVSTDDGATWTYDSTPCLTTGSETWENLTVGVPCVFYESGTWHMYYRGTGNGTFQVGIGYATSSTPGGPFTRVQSAPSYVIGGAGRAVESGPGRIIKVGSTYWAHVSNIAGDSTRGIRVFSSTNKTTWTEDSQSASTAPIFTGGRFCNNIWKDGDFYYTLVPHYRLDGSLPSGQNVADLELWRSSHPAFYPAVRELLGTVVLCGPSGTWSEKCLDTPTVLVTDITKSAYPTVTGGRPWVFYAGENAGGAWKSGLIKLPRLPKIKKVLDAIPSSASNVGPLTKLGSWAYDNIAANKSFGRIYRLGDAGSTRDRYLMAKAGSIVRIEVYSTDARSAGSVTATVLDASLNPLVQSGGPNSGSNVTGGISAGAATSAVTEFAPGVVRLAKDTAVLMALQSSSWGTTTSEITVDVYVAYDLT